MPGLARIRESRLQRFDRPVHHGVSGVVERLADNFPSDSGVAVALDLHDGGDPILIEKRMINRPSHGAIFF
jgi:Na+-translocating ferredoxin:NAD+ oxidoreductase RnfC subunit